MRNFWFCIFYILISSKSFANDQALPALPNIPGSIGATQDSVIPPPSKDDVNSASVLPSFDLTPGLKEGQGDHSVTTELGEDNFIDLGSYKLPRVQPSDQDTEISLPAAPAAALPAPSVAVPATPVEALPAPSVAVPATPVEALPAPSVAVPATPVEALPAPSVAVPATSVEALPEPAVAVPTAPVSQAPEALKAKPAKQKKSNHSDKIVALTPVQQKFIQDEMIMLLIPDDDIVLGKLTTEAALKEMEGKEYIHLFWKGYEYADKEPQDHETEMFITTYNHHYVNYARFPLSVNEATDVAFDAVVSSNIDNLRTMLDNYPILQSYNKYGDSLLIEAVEMNDLPLVKLLLIRGAYIDPVNNKGESAFVISEKYGTDSMYQLMQDAVFRGKIR